MQRQGRLGRMIHFATGLLAACLLASPAWAVGDVPLPALETYVRLNHPAVGCPTLDAEAKVAEAALLRDEATMDDVIRRAKCRPFKSLRGVVSHTAEDAVCILGIGLSTCYWFASEAVVPARDG